MSAKEQDRAERFDRLNKQQAGELTRDVYTSRQSDAEAARKRFAVSKCSNWKPCSTTRLESSTQKTIHSSNCPAVLAER